MISKPSHTSQGYLAYTGMVISRSMGLGFVLQEGNEINKTFADSWALGFIKAGCFIRNSSHDGELLTAGWHKNSVRGFTNFQIKHFDGSVVYVDYPAFQSSNPPSDDEAKGGIGTLEYSATKFISDGSNTPDGKSNYPGESSKAEVINTPSLTWIEKNKKWLGITAVIFLIVLTIAVLIHKPVTANG